MHSESSRGAVVKVIKLKDLLKEVSEGGPGSGKKKTGSAPKLQEPWKEPHVPVKNKSKMPRKSRSKYSDPTRRQVRSTKGKRAPKLENSLIDEAYGKPLAVDDVYNEAVSHLQEAVAIVRLYMTRLEDEGDISQSDPKLAQPYKAVARAGMYMHVQLSKWKAVMEGVEKVKHQQRGK